MGKKSKRRSPSANSKRIYKQFGFSLIGLIAGCAIILIVLSIRYKVYDYNYIMRILALTPCFLGSIIISLEYFFNFSTKFTKNDISYLKREWKKTARRLGLCVAIIETIISVLLGLIFDRNGNMLRFLIDSSYSGLFVFIVNILSSFSVLLIQRLPLAR